MTFDSQNIESIFKALEVQAKLPVQVRHKDLLAEVSSTFAKYKLRAPIASKWKPDEPFIIGGRADESFFEDLQKPLPEIADHTIAALASEGYMLRRASDYKYFLPRILELVLAGNYPETVFTSMEVHEFETWAPTEKELVHRVIVETFNDILSGHHAVGINYSLSCCLRGDDAALDFLESLADVYPLEYLFDVWEKCRTEHAQNLFFKSAISLAQRIHNIAEYNSDNEKKKELLDEEAETMEFTDEERKLAGFLLAGKTMERILNDMCSQNAITDEEREYFKNQFAKAHTQL